MFYHQIIIDNVADCFGIIFNQHISDPLLIFMILVLDYSDVSIIYLYSAKFRHMRELNDYGIPHI